MGGGATQPSAPAPDPNVGQAQLTAANTQKQLADLATSQYSLSSPFLTEMFGQGMEGLKTGGIGAQIPLISRMIEGNRSALSTTLNQTDILAQRYGLDKSPQYLGQRGNIQFGGESAIANIGPNLAASFISSLLGPGTNITGQGIGGLGTAAGASGSLAGSITGASAGVRSSQIGAGSNILTQLMQSGSLLGAGIAAGGGFSNPFSGWFGGGASGTTFGGLDFGTGTSLSAGGSILPAASSGGLDLGVTDLMVAGAPFGF